MFLLSGRKKDYEPSFDKTQRVTVVYYNWSHISVLITMKCSITTDEAKKEEPLSELILAVKLDLRIHVLENINENTYKGFNLFVFAKSEARMWLSLIRVEKTARMALSKHKQHTYLPGSNRPMLSSLDKPWYLLSLLSAFLSPGSTCTTY